MKVDILTIEYLRERLSYEPETGLFRWKTSLSSRCKVGSVAGSLCKTHGYWHIRIDRISYRASRLAMFITNGKLPSNYVDHINGIKTDDRIANLREATVSQNGQNTKVRSDSKSGLKGAHYDKRRRAYLSKIRISGKSLYLGYFHTAKEAHNAYCVAAKHHYGEFARTQ